MTATYNYWLVALSYAAAILTFYAAGRVTGQARAGQGQGRGRGRARYGWLTAGEPRSQRRDLGHQSDSCDVSGGDETEEQTERKYRIMFDQSVIGMFSASPDGHLLEGNPAMASLLGYSSRDELLAMVEPWWNNAVSRKRLDELIASLQATGQEQSFELEFLRKDGSRAWFSGSLRAEWRSNQLRGFSGSLENVTERRRLREQALQSQKLQSVGQLAAGIAHEINTPVQYIGDNLRFLKDAFTELVALHAGYARLLAAARAQELPPQMVEDLAHAVQKADVGYLLEEIPKAIEQALQGVSQVATLVGAMKEFSHPGTEGKIPLNLNRAIESTVTVARNEWKYVAEMKLELDPTLPLVCCLGGEFEQVVLHLIVNAAQAIEEISVGEGRGQGLITIRTRSVAGWVEVRVEDTGNGIAEQIQPRIFDPFFTTKEIGKGMGQGLAIARSVVVDKHQGTLEFETEEGHGTSFIIRLPCEAAA